MGTSAIIGIKDSNNNSLIKKGIYCHYDGYPSYVGSILSKYYNTTARVLALIELGDISCLGKDLEPNELVRRFGFDGVFNPEFKKLSKEEQERLEKDSEQNPCTIAYCRDRGEEFNQIEMMTIRQAKGMVDYVYYWDGEEWHWT